MNRALARLIETLDASGALRPLGLLGDAATILMWHRFDRPKLALLREQLAWLRATRRPVLSLEQARARLLEGGPLGHPVVFTVDDGYADFEQALPVFAEFDCPVTVFLVSGFLDGATWLWWDQIEHVFEHTRLGALQVELGDFGTGSWTWNEGTRSAVQADLVERLKRLKNSDRLATIARVAEKLEVTIPAAAPARYAPLTWDAVRAAEARGASFGPHTVTHPILSTVDDAVAEHEIAQSWRRVREEARAAVPVFCYPNGDPGSFGSREERLVAAAGLPMALTTVPGYATRAGAAGAGAFRVPRFAAPATRAELSQIASGIERIKMMVRSQ